MASVANRCCCSASLSTRRPRREDREGTCAGSDNPVELRPPPGTVIIAPGARDRAGVAPLADTDSSPRNTGASPVFWMIRATLW